MYSNQKDQISLEEAYNNVHNETINEDANETLGASVVYGAMVLAPLIVNFLKAKFGKNIEIEDFKNKLFNFLKNPNIKNDLEQQGMDYVKSHIIDMLKSIKGVTGAQQAAIKDIQTMFPQDNNPSLIQKAKSLFTNAISKQNSQNMQQNVKRNLGLSGPNVTGFRG
jgi:hypothetical protein